ncbi:Shugoshin C terminus [Phytophthora infestans]|uniref:Shugoshin C terminus n=1 Tax=Phytophthora infestans TaxID=4787 RepID=A0A833SY44_PHYIN|nr:Shugoshin C terminus [Phytophthora infestans]KAF4136495.1 Shugoshin C terminus [Phytophthora infestans]
MTQDNSGARALSIMQELRQLREKVGVYSDKNRELAKALTVTKQELTKARVAKSTVFSDKVVEWMEARHKPAVHDKATQCNFEDLDHASIGKMQLEPDPPLSPFRSCRSIPMPHSEPRTLFATTSRRDPMAFERPTTIAENESSGESDDAGALICKKTGPEGVPGTSSFQSTVVSFNTASSNRTGSQAGVKRRLRQRDANMSYVEPNLNTKLRRGDYYGLGKRASQTITRPSTPRINSGTRCNKSPFVPGRFGQQRSPFRSRRSRRRIKRISYTEPKLNIKLRQGDKFTFTF